MRGEGWDKQLAPASDRDAGASLLRELLAGSTARMDEMPSAASPPRRMGLNDHRGRASGRRDHVLGISRDAVLVQVETVQLAFLRDAQQAHRVDGVHHRQGDARMCETVTIALPMSCAISTVHAAAVEQALQRRRVVGRERARWRRTCRRRTGPARACPRCRTCRAPGTAPIGSSMRSYSSSSTPTTTITPAMPPSRIDAGRADPVAGAGDRDQAGQEAVDREARRPTSCSCM